MGRSVMSSSSSWIRCSSRSKRSEEHTSELQSQSNLVCRLLLEKKKITYSNHNGCFAKRYLYTVTLLAAHHVCDPASLYRSSPSTSRDACKACNTLRQTPLLTTS